MPPREEGVSIDVLREAARLRVEDAGLRQTAREIGISHQTLLRFLGGVAESHGRNVAKVREWYERETNEVLRLRRENADLKRRLAECERERRAAK
jgi:hypothetical protein